MGGDWNKAEWKRVESEGELRVGITVKLTGCSYCGKTHRMALLSRHLAPTACLSPLHNKCVAWLPEGDGHDSRGYGHCFSVAIHEGRLFRLVDTIRAGETTTRKLETTK